MFSEKRKKFLENLVNVPSPSGMEEKCTEVFFSYFYPREMKRLYARKSLNLNCNK